MSEIEYICKSEKLPFDDDGFIAELPVSYCTENLENSYYCTENHGILPFFTNA